MIILYPGIILASGWTSVNIFKIIGYVNQLKNERPECTQANPNRSIAFLSTFILLFLMKDRIERGSTKFFNKYISEEKFPLNSEARKSKSEMLGERIFKLIISLFCICSLYKIMMQDDCDFLDIRVGGSISRPLYYNNYPCQKIPAYLDNFYVFKLSYHLYELGYTIVYQRARPDFPEYMLHHLMTWSLIFFSYSLNMLPIGSAVMILHDITDFAVTMFKITIDVTPVVVQGFFYLFMIISWVYLRLWFFPAHVIWRLQEECYDQPC
jgi:hypothetical protein